MTLWWGWQSILFCLTLVPVLLFQSGISAHCYAIYFHICIYIKCRFVSALVLVYFELSFCDVCCNVTVTTQWPKNMLFILCCIFLGSVLVTIQRAKSVQLTVEYEQIFPVLPMLNIQHDIVA